MANNDADMAMAGDDRILIVEDVRAFVAPGIGVIPVISIELCTPLGARRGSSNAEPQKARPLGKCFPSGRNS